MKRGVHAELQGGDLLIRGAIKKVIYILVVAVIAIAIFWLLVQFEVINLQDALKGIWIQVYDVTAPVLGGGECRHLQENCERWVIDGLGLVRTYGDANIAEAARSCGIKTSICPDLGASRVGLQDCLEMCLEITECRKSKSISVTGEKAIDVQECVQEVIDKNKVST